MLDIVDDLGAGSGPTNGHPRETRDGFEAEVGRPFVGYRVVESGIEIEGVSSELIQGL